MGREGIEPPLSIDGCVTDSCAPWRDRPMIVGTGCGAGPDDDDASDAVVKVQWPSWMPGASTPRRIRTPTERVGAARAEPLHQRRTSVG